MAVYGSVPSLSSDGGRRFSSRRWNYTEAIAAGLRFDIDRTNGRGGTVLEGWSTGKPLLARDGSVWMQVRGRTKNCTGLAQIVGQL